MNRLEIRRTSRVRLPTGSQPGWSRWTYAALRGLLGPADMSLGKRNELKLYHEVVWAQGHGAAVQFHAPYALHLGATNAEIGLLTSLPSLIALLIGMPAGYWFSQQTNRGLWLGVTVFIHRLSLLLAAFIPFLSIDRPGAAMVLLIVIFSVPAHCFTVGWLPMLADVIPERNWGRVFAVRNILTAVALTGALFLVGSLLSMSAFPTNYQVMYLAAFGSSLVSTFIIARVKAPAATSRPRGGLNIAPAALWVQVKEAATQQPDFVRIVVNTFAHAIGVWMVPPVYVLYYVRTLNASDSWIALNVLLANLSPIIGYILAQRAVTRWGENLVLKLTVGVVGLYPLLVGLSPDLNLILVWTTLYSLIVSGWTLAHNNMMLKIAPAAQRTNYLAAYQTIMNFGAFVMPFVGIFLAELFGFAAILIAGGILCLAGSSIFFWRPLQTADNLFTLTGDGLQDALHPPTNK